MLKLFYFRSADGVPNFGDELNPWLWRLMLGDAIDESGDTLFTGIGTVLNDRLPPARHTWVFGSGVGFGTGTPAVDHSWTFYCVRGPQSARALGLPASAAITDPALLIAELVEGPSPQPAHAFSFMPHYRNASARWASVCSALGFGYIDPRHDRDTVLAGLRQTRVLISEAMHGAIVADALGIPWIAVRTGGAGTLELKWRDWCESLALQHRPKAMVPLYEASRSAGRARLKSALAAAQLFGIAKTTAPQLSAERVRAERLEQLHERLECVRKDLQR